MDDNDKKRVRPEFVELGDAVDKLIKEIYKSLEWLLIPTLDFMVNILEKVTKKRKDER